MGTDPVELFDADKESLAEVCTAAFVRCNPQFFTTEEDAAWAYLAEAVKAKEGGDA